LFIITQWIGILFVSWLLALYVLNLRYSMEN
jgi:hypothetical protein